jgi:hypothetical protein
MDTLNLLQHLNGAEKAISDGRLATALAHVAGAKEQAESVLVDALAQGADSRWFNTETGQFVEPSFALAGVTELQLGHFCTSTWEEYAWCLVEHGGWEWVDPAAKYWIRKSS